jgi:hypothetical protein
MRFLQIAFFCDGYLDGFYGNKPALEGCSFAEIQKSLFLDGYSAAHYFAQAITGYGYDSQLIVASDRRMQMAWHRENVPGLDLGGEQVPAPGAYGRFLKDDLMRILIAQVNHYDPDVLYLQDPVGTDARFLRMLSVKPRLVIGWRAADIPKGCDWRGIDLMVSNHRPSLEKGKKYGIRWQERLQPGFPEWINDSLKDEQFNEDVSFTGGVSPAHGNRIRILTGLSSCLMKEGVDFSLNYHLDPEPRLPAGICMHAKGKVWGMDMYRTLKRSRINLNVHIDLAGNEAANMRLFEATGVGGFLLTDFKDNIRDFFEPGKEIETFRSVDELLEKVLHYLEHPRDRHAIAAAGQKKCLERFTLKHSASQLDHLIRKALKAKSNISGNRERILSLFQRGLNPVP